MLGVAAVVWAFFGGVVVGSLGVLVWYTVRLVRGVKSFGRAARAATDELNRAADIVNDELRRAEEGLSRVEQGMAKVRERRA